MTGAEVGRADEYGEVLAGIVALLSQARSAAARSVNSVMTVAYWQVGEQIVGHEQSGRARASYGDTLLERLSVDLTARFGRGFSKQNLYQMRQFRLVWTPERILQTLSGESLPPILQTLSGELVLTTAGGVVDVAGLARVFPLPWSAYVRLLSVRDDGARSFYEAEALRNGWTVRQLNRQINSMFYERTALSRDKAAMLTGGGHQVAEDVVSPEQAIKDPFVLEFLGLKDEYSETDLEDALITHLADFLLELGGDFAFVGRQRRMRIDDSWFRVDLTMYHRRLRALVLIDLKIGRFSYADAGQMHMYLNYARENWMVPGENPPVGLILCAQKGADEARYALEGLPNPVLAAEFRQTLPDEAVLAKELARTRRELERRP
ncbi:MAG: PDDEXK nuclease domain-containing protein [Propionibacteriaceae bacterium]|nr:PDDEXK nuclease domain-containing protein [Propionibacteriaceae bacterium]